MDRDNHITRLFDRGDKNLINLINKHIMDETTVEGIPQNFNLRADFFQKEIDKEIRNQWTLLPEGRYGKNNYMHESISIEELDIALQATDHYYSYKGKYFLTMKDLCEEMGIGRQAFRNAVKRGDIKKFVKCTKLEGYDGNNHNKA